MDKYGTVEYFTALDTAAEFGCVERVKELLPHSTFEEGCRALCTAVVYKQYAVVEYLITTSDFECSVNQIVFQYQRLRAEEDRTMFNLLYTIGGRESINLLDKHLVPVKHLPMLREWANEEDAVVIAQALDGVGPHLNNRKKM